MKFGAWVRRIWAGICVGTLVLLTACALDNRGLHVPGAGPSGTGGTTVFDAGNASGGGTGSGGADLTGGTSGSGSVVGSGGILGSGGELGAGGDGSGGSPGGGSSGTGGDTPGSGGVLGSGGDNGSHAGTGGENACASCAPCFKCGKAGVCDLDPTSTWKISCVSASIAADGAYRVRTASGCFACR